TICESKLVPSFTRPARPTAAPGTPPSPPLAPGPRAESASSPSPLTTTRWLLLLPFRLRLGRRRPRQPSTPHALPRCEALETRDLPTTFAPTYRPVRHPGHAAPLSTAGPTGYTPAQVRHAYGFDQISFGGVTGD